MSHITTWRSSNGEPLTITCYDDGPNTITLTSAIAAGHHSSPKDHIKLPFEDITGFNKYSSGDNRISFPFWPKGTHKTNCT